MKKIIVRTDNEKVNILYKQEDEEIIDVTGNTNIIDTEELLFKENYFYKNKNIIANFIRGILLTKNINTLNIIDEDLINISLDIAKSIKEIKKVYISCDTPLKFEAYEKILNYKNLQYLNCYDMQQFMLDKLDRDNLKIDLRNESGLSSDFTILNELYHYSDIYYKNILKIDGKLNENDVFDFETFCKVNRKLKEIEIYNYNIKLIREVIRILVNNNIRNIKISIIPTSTNKEDIQNNIEVFKFINKKYAKRFGLKVKLKYSLEYKEKNLMKQFNVISIRNCSMVIALLLVVGFLIIQYKEYRSNQDIEKLQDLVQADEIIEDPISQNEEIIENDVPEEIEKKQTSATSVEDYNKLLSVNSETVGWIKVSNTKINYPVVKHSDNDYYLKHNFYNYSTNLGWIFMDYRNNIDELSKNTIIYGHSNTRGDIMFGSLHYVLKESWYKNTNNQVITFNTIHKQMKWQIFSIYIIDPVSDYLYTKFFTDEKYQTFIDLIKGRSIYNFNVNVTPDDNILTLSTCYSNGKQRLVVHAKLIK